MGSLVLGEDGQYSRILNRIFTPTTHESLPFKAAPGQLSSQAIIQERISQGFLIPKTFYILGHNIAYSVSPPMQNAAFQACSLPHIYKLMDVETVEEFIESIANKDDFGGASVTIPHKQTIMPYMDHISDAAKDIGSVNTILVENNTLVGHNTDWKGIAIPLERRLFHKKHEQLNALILGAGGTARAAVYAAQHLGFKTYMWNRTPSKLLDIQKSFPHVHITDHLDSDFKSQIQSLSVVISTLPASSEFQLPPWILQHKPIIFDVNYKPFTTKLLAQGQRAGCELVRGSEMLWEQGVGQFELWTQRTAPYKIMKNVVLENCEP